MRKTRSIHKLTHLRTSGLPGHYKGSVLPKWFTGSLVKQHDYSWFTPYEKPNPDTWRIWVGPFGERGNLFVDEHGMWSLGGFTRSTQLQQDNHMWELFNRATVGSINTRGLKIPLVKDGEDAK